MFYFNKIGKRLSLLAMVAFTFSCREPLKTEMGSTTDAVERAHSEIWGRFINEYNCLNDYTELDGSKKLPTQEECRDAKPNGLGWWSPIENSAMFGGLYMDGIVGRWKLTKSPDDAAKAKRIASGLMLVASVSATEGFVSRGVSADGVSHYPIGSHDQIGGWVFGLWVYLQSGIPDELEKTEIEDKFVTVAKAMEKIDWQVPAEPPFNIRGSVGIFDHNAGRLLFILRATYLITGDDHWNELYIKLANERDPVTKRTRLEIIGDGLEYQFNKSSTWDESPSYACTRLLWELEEDPIIKEYYREGLEKTALACLESVKQANRYNPSDKTPYEDWREMNALWEPQSTSDEAVAVALRQLDDLNKKSRRRRDDELYVREPAFAAWLISLAPDETLLRQRKPALEQLILNYEYNNLYEVWFFPLIGTWYRINAL